jgi:hypothetical protein
MGSPETTIRKADYHALAPLLAKKAVPREVVEKLDAIVGVARKGRPKGSQG